MRGPRSDRIDLPSERPVVVMSRGHSGSRVIAWALELLGISMGSGRAKSSLDVGDDAFARAIKTIARRNLSLPPYVRPDEDDLAMFQRRVQRYAHSLGVHRLSQRHVAWGWKLPETYLIPNFVTATFPLARLVHLVRDGRDVAFKYHRTDRPDQRLGKRLLEHIGALEQPHHLQAARSWEFQVRRFQRFRERWKGRVHEIRFEDLCSDPVEALTDLARFLELPSSGRCRDQLQQHVTARPVAEHRRHDPALLREVEASVGRTLRSFGYETSTPPSREGVSPRLKVLV